MICLLHSKLSDGLSETLKGSVSTLPTIPYDVFMMMFAEVKKQLAKTMLLTKDLLKGRCDAN